MLRPLSHPRRVPAPGSRLLRCLVLFAGLLPGLFPLGAQVFDVSSVPAYEPVELTLSNLQMDVPDNDATGSVSEMVVSGFRNLVSSIEVSFTMTGRDGSVPFNGDYLVTLTHDTGHSVLLNRVGRRDGASVGYGDGGFDVRLADAGAGDVHVYRLVLGGGHTVPLSVTDTPAALTGTWQPDGRAVDPGTVTDASARSAMLSQFAGLDPNGTWTLFVADLSEGGLGRVTQWGIVVTPVPEPGWAAWVAGGALGGWALFRRLRSRRSRTEV